MKYYGKITDPKDLVTKEWVENNTATDIDPATIGAVKIAGDTMTGELVAPSVKTQGTTLPGFTSINSTTGTKMYCGVETEQPIHGIYSYVQNRWIINGDSSNIYVGGNLYHQIYYGTTDPDASLGAEGDVYFKYTE